MIVNPVFILNKIVKIRYRLKKVSYMPFLSDCKLDNRYCKKFHHTNYSVTGLDMCA